MTKLTGAGLVEGQVALFQGSMCTRVGPPNTKIAPADPVPISQAWPGSFDADLDAVAVWTDGTVYLFKGSQYAQHDPATGQMADGYPKEIADGWPNTYKGDLDAVVVWPNGKVFLFAGDTYVRFDVERVTADPGYPAPIADHWPDVFTSDIGASILVGDTAYFVKGREYLAYGVTNEGAPDGAQPVAGSWLDTFGATTPIDAGTGDGTGTTSTSDPIREYFPTFSKPIEGRIAYMYQDIKGLVTVAVGNLIDRPEDAAALPFERRDTHVAATQEEIVAEWHSIKGAPGLAAGGHKAAEKVAKLMLSEQAIDELVRRKFDSNEAVLAKFYPDWDRWPADARLGAHSILWAGAGFPNKWTGFNAAANADDWTTAAGESHLSEVGNPGTKARNEANHQLFMNAAAAVAQGLDRSHLNYPTAL